VICHGRKAEAVTGKSQLDRIRSLQSGRVVETELLRLLLQMIEHGKNLIFESDQEVHGVVGGGWSFKSVKTGILDQIA
jgi:hypothetical protein